MLAVAVGLLTPTIKAQIVADPCAAPWEVVHGSERPGDAGNSGFYAVKFNRCTGDTMVFGADDMEISDGDTWHKLGVKSQ